MTCYQDCSSSHLVKVPHPGAACNFKVCAYPHPRDRRSDQSPHPIPFTPPSGITLIGALLWKCADVLPLRKIPHPKSIDSDLKPISLTPVLSKVLEGFVFNWLAPIVLPKIDFYQFGEVKNLSATTALIHLIHQWLAAAEIPQTLVRSCLIDFSRAFDRINYNILLRRLQTLGVPPILLNWCASFLWNIQQQVKLGTFKSSWKHINGTGVPQGTKLGPLFFLVMVKDFPAAFLLYKFTDDMTMFEVVPVPMIQTTTLQQEVDSFCQWATTNNTKLNTKKLKPKNS